MCDYTVLGGIHELVAILTVLSPKNNNFMPFHPVGPDAVREDDLEEPHDETGYLTRCMFTAHFPVMHQNLAR